MSLCLTKMSEIKEDKTANCPVCRSARTSHAFSAPDAPILRCADCNFLFLYPQPSDEVLRRIYTENYFLGATDEQLRARVAAEKTTTAELYLDQLARHGIRVGRLLEVGCGDGYLLAAAERRGFEVMGVEYSEHAARRARAALARGQVLVGELSDLNLPAEAFDVCVLADVIEHVRDPRSFLATVRDCLKPGGGLLVATPSTDSWSARLMRSRWMEFKTEHMSYFSRCTMEMLLSQTGFHSSQFFPGYKIISLRSVQAHFESYPVPLWTPLVRLAFSCLPGSWLNKPRRLAGSGMLVLAAKNTAIPPQ
jgi:cyclopropane fatty-acyl-phospholipid synthase-like methyltransferase